MVISLHNEIEIFSLSIQTDRPEQIVQNLIRFIEGNQETQVIRDSRVSNQFDLSGYAAIIISFGCSQLFLIKPKIWQAHQRVRGQGHNKYWLTGFLFYN